MDPAEDHPLPFFLRIEGGNGQQEVRTVLIDGEPWFVAKDVCEALGYQSSNRTQIMGHVPDEWKGSTRIATPPYPRGCPEHC